MGADLILDCVVIGYNDPDFRTFAAKHREMEAQSGAYHEIRTNSVIRHGERVTYMDFLNSILHKATGEPSNLNVFEAPSLGVCYLTSFLKQRGFRVEFVNFFNHDKERLKELLASAPRSVAITTTFYVEDDPIIEIVKFVRQHCPQTKIIVGGPHIFNRAADLDSDTLAFVYGAIGADIYVIDSQGELTLSKVIGVLRGGGLARLGAVSNLMYTLDGTSFCRTERQVEDNDLDDGSVNWRHFDPKIVTPLAYLRSARSCPFTCSFCQYPILAGAHDVNAIPVMERQLEDLRAMGTTDLVFIDDTFNVPLPRFKNLLQMMIDRKFGFRWVSFLRCSNVDEAAIDLMKESGCAGVLLGVESGDQQMLKYMNKAVKLDRYWFGIRELKKRGIPTYASLICGFPGETEQSVRNTIAFIEEAGPTFFNVQLYFHDPRSPINGRAEEFKIRGGGYSWSHRTMDWREAIDWSVYMYKNIHNSIFFSLHGMSLWGISYLLSKGLSLEEIKAFGKVSRALLFSSLVEQNFDFTEQEDWLVEMFQCRGSDPLRVFDETFWRAELAGSLPKVTLFAGGKPALLQAAEPQTKDVVLDATLTGALGRMAVASHTTVRTVLLALLNLLLFQQTGQNDICVGLLLADKIVPIRTRLSPDMEFNDLLASVIRSIDAALNHQDYLPDTRPNVTYRYRGLGSHADDRAVCADDRHVPELQLVAQEEGGELRLCLELQQSVVPKDGPLNI